MSSQQIGQGLMAFKTPGLQLAGVGVPYYHPKYRYVDKGNQASLFTLTAY